MFVRQNVAFMVGEGYYSALECVELCLKTRKESKFNLSDEKYIPIDDLAAIFDRVLHVSRCEEQGELKHE